MLLPLVWGSVSGTIKSLRPDLTVITPKNLMLFVWFNKLVIIPLEIIWIGNRIPVEHHLNQDISTEICITLVSFGTFVVGWTCFSKKKIHRLMIPLPFLNTWASVYFLVALISLSLLYGSFENYISGAIFTYVTREIVEQNATLLGLLANIGQRFWAFGVLLAWYKWRRKKGKLHGLRHILWLILCLAGILSSNRSNMVYPLLTLMSVMYGGWKTRHPFWLVLLLLILIALSLFFGYVRVQSSLDTEGITLLFHNYLEHDEYITYAHQLYFGSPYQITPLLSIENPSSTLLASILDPIPVIGKAVREQSGPYIYNLAYHQSLVSQDKVIPVAGELYYNGGYFLVALGYTAIGVVYRWLDYTFKHNVLINPPLAAAFFYLTMLFNATLLLSLSVLMQFLVYNAAPALLIIAANWSRIRKAS
ncbi:oligosaccharide repeat unit polymerase [Runella aurantiaca]|uniref:Oligosaccharide repeat unit polymerase n=1 Tax=Runella aurantiaca TaxID=2282308 RepID=A0A369IBV7_9BACT|nr:oligosaccharide repeat unit polymerase [Runella aurantiaca]